MHYCCRQNVVLPLLYFIVLNLHLLITQSDGRYLRPSDHGLAYQDTSYSHPTTKSNATEMLSFFNGGRTVSLPEAKNLTGIGDGGGVGGATWWKNRERRMSHDARRNHAREILLITSLVCGLTGVVLLVVWAFMFLIRYRKQQQQQQPQLGRGEWSKHNSLSPHESTSALAGDDGGGSGGGGVQIK